MKRGRAEVLVRDLDAGQAGPQRLDRFSTSWVTSRVLAQGYFSTTTSSPAWSLTTPSPIWGGLPVLRSRPGPERWARRRVGHDDALGILRFLDVSGVQSRQALIC